MKKSNMKYIITIFTAVICIISAITVFAQRAEIPSDQKKKEEILKKWAEYYGDSGKRMQYMSENMKKRYISDQLKRANENMFSLLYSINSETETLHDKLDVINFRIENNDTIFYTLRSNSGKEYYQVEYVTMKEKNNNIIVENSTLSHASNWKDWNKPQSEPLKNTIYSSFLGENESSLYSPIINVTGTEKIDKELLPMFLNHVQSVFEDGHSSYYIIEMLNIDVENVKTKDNTTTVDFNLQEVLRRNPKNPDTVEYIKKAKENESEDYQKLYRQYYSPFYGNYRLRFSGNKTNTDSFRIYTGEINDKGKVLYNWSIEQQFPDMDSDGTKWLLGTINSTKDDYGRTLFTINRKQWNKDSRCSTENGFFITSYGKQLTYPLHKQASVTCMNQNEIQSVNTQSFTNAASKASFGRSRLFWFKIENNYIVEINELLV